MVAFSTNRDRGEPGCRFATAPVAPALVQYAPLSRMSLPMLAALLVTGALGATSLSPDLERSMTAESLSAARDAIATAFGVLPALFAPAAQGPLVREAQRHLAGWTLQPIAMLLAEEASQKLGADVMVDVLRPVQAYDAGGRARALATIVQALAQAKEAGLAPGDLNAALTLVNWGDGDKAA